MVTPTGAAILGALARFEQPAMRVQRVGYGFGSREFPWPNAVRAWIGEDLPERGARPSAAPSNHEHHHAHGEHEHAHGHDHPHAHERPAEQREV
jgi:pyridinium-3,5-bisthiocarboxylic acid mononucleotide nickel chelatase